MLNIGKDLKSDEFTYLDASRSRAVLVCGGAVRSHPPGLAHGAADHGVGPVVVQEPLPHRVPGDLAAQEHGDARRALNLLWIAGEIAEAEGRDTISIEDVERAGVKIDYDLYVNIVRSLPKQSQIILASIIKSIEDIKTGSKYVETGQVFGRYQRLCNENGLKMLSHIRVSNLIAELRSV